MTKQNGYLIGTIVIGHNENEKEKTLFRGARGGIYHIGTKRRPYSRVYLSQTRMNCDKRISFEYGVDFREL